MSLASCCGLVPMPSVDDISNSATLGVVCGVILILEAIGIAIVLRNTTRRFWRRKFLLATAAIGVSTCIAAWQAFGVYDRLRAENPLLLTPEFLTPSDGSAMTQWAGFGTFALWVTIILLIVGASYAWLAQDY